MEGGYFEQQVTMVAIRAVSDFTHLWKNLFVDFRCQKCGAEIDLAPAVCPSCCEDHDYRYERDLGGRFCFHCGQKAPDDFYED